MVVALATPLNRSWTTTRERGFAHYTCGGGVGYATENSLAHPARGRHQQAAEKVSQGWRVDGVVLQAAADAEAAEPGDGLRVVKHVLGQLESETAASQQRRKITLTSDVERWRPLDWSTVVKGVFNRRGLNTPGDFYGSRLGKSRRGSTPVGLERAASITVGLNAPKTTGDWTWEVSEGGGGIQAPSRL